MSDANEFVSWVQDTERVSMESFSRDGYRTVAAVISDSVFDDAKELADEHGYSYYGTVLKSGVGEVEVFSKDDYEDIDLFIQALQE